MDTGKTEILLLLTLFYPHILTHKISLLLSPTDCLAAKFLTNLVLIGRKKTCYPTTVRTVLLTPWHGTINTAFYKNTVMSHAHILFHTSSALQIKHFNSSGFNWKLWCMLLSTVVRINRREIHFNSDSEDVALGRFLPGKRNFPENIFRMKRTFRT